VPWRDPEAIAREVIDLLGNDEKRLELSARAAAYGRDMRWPAVARSYLRAFGKARDGHTNRLRAAFQTKTLSKRPAELPDINLEHLQAMTDETGLLQHAAFTVPCYEEGYCLDDNARALRLMALVEDTGTEEARTVRALSSRYFAFVRHAFNEECGRFRNFMTYDRRWTESAGSEDSHARALWALGTIVGRSTDPGKQSLGGSLFHAALPAVTGFTSPRAWAFTLLALDEYFRAFKGDSNVQSLRMALAEKLLDIFRRTSRRDWPWFEDQVTYCNARLPQALVLSGARMGHEEMVAVGLTSLEWLASQQCSDDGYFAPVGSNGFYTRGETKATFDQQPVEAYAMISACIEARRVTGNEVWSERARSAFNWFFGQNQLRQPLYDPTTGGCRDGLHTDRVNQNQGAESTLSFLLSLCEMRAADRSDLEKATAPSPSMKLSSVR
jgi:hypothetical protein